MVYNILREKDQPHKQDSAKGQLQANKDAVHRFRRREIPGEGVHVAAQSPQDRAVYHVQKVHHLFSDPFHNTV